MTHLEEILSLHDLAKDPGAGDFQSFRERSKPNVENRCLHQHVFDTRLVVDMVDHMELQILDVELLECPRGFQPLIFSGWKHSNH